MKKYLFLAAILVASPALASPKYLNCSVKSEGGSEMKINVAIAEDLQAVTYHINEARLFFRVDAMFTPSMIRWNNLASRSIDMVFMINRTTLEMAVVDQIGSSISTSKGSCVVTVAPKQAV